MKKVLLIIGLMISVNMMFAQTATLKLGTVYDPAAGTVLVPVTLEAISNGTTGNNLISSWSWYIVYNPSVLNAGAAGSPIVQLNINPQFPASNYLTNIIANSPSPGLNTIAVIYSAAVSGMGTVGMKFFDIQFTYVAGGSDVTWDFSGAKDEGGKLVKFFTNMADDEGNEFVITGVNGFVGPTPATGKTWTGAGGDTDWFNPANWSPVGVPIGTDDCTIPGTKAMVTISGGVATTAMLTVASGGGIIIAPDGGLTTNGLYTNDGQLIIQSDNTIGYAGSYIDNGGIGGTGTFEFDRNVLCSGTVAGSSNPFGWHYLSSPFNGFTTDMLPDYFVNAWDQPTGMWMQYGFGIPPNPPCTPWPTTTLGTLDAWSINRDVNYPYPACPGSPAATGVQVEFMSGAAGVHTGPYAKPVGFGAGYSKWNLVANPYPSGLDVNLLSFTGGAVAATYFYEGCSGNYYYWATGMGTYVMPSTNGFFVETTAAGNVVMNNAARAHNADFFWKDEVANLLTLQASGNDRKDVLYVRFADDVTAGFDNNGDAHKLFSETEGIPQIYTMAGSEMLAINALPETASVPMGFRANGTGTYTIEAIETSEFQNVVLEDLFTGVETDLLTGSYTFNYNVGDNDSRFVIHFTPLGTPELSANSINIWAANQMIYVQAPATTGDIVVFNMMGQEVVRTAIVPGLNEIPMKDINTYYIVKVLGSDVTETGKVFIK